MSARQEKPKVIVVDDDKDVLASVELVLKRHFDVLPLSRGGDLAGQAAVFQPDLIILDVRLADADGFQLCRRLRAEPETRPVPVLFLTGLGSDEDYARFLEAGGDSYLVKPLVPEELVSRARELLGARTGGGAWRRRS